MVRRVATLLYFVPSILTIGLVAFPGFIHPAFRLRSRKGWILLVVYLAADIGLWYVWGKTSDDIETMNGYDVAAAFGTLSIMTGSCVHLALLRRDVLNGPKVPNGVADGVHCGLFSVDVANSGVTGHNSEAFVQFRRVLFQTLEESFMASGIDWYSCVRHDTGDGMIVVVPPQFRKSLLLNPLLQNFAMRLAERNRAASEGVRIRVRAAVHSGDVRIDEYGVTGRPKVLLARLLDAKPLREALAGSDPAVPLVVLVSDRFHDDVIDDGYPLLDPLVYHPVLVEVKETEVRAWLHIPYSGTPPYGNTP